jgi:mono/diheme cytochrome c family protein
MAGRVAANIGAPSPDQRRIALPSPSLPRRALSWALFLSLAWLALVVPAHAADKNLADKGEALVRENCSRCHAIGKEGDSPHPQAPPFRTLSSRYPIDNLSESLGEGIVSGHPDMPVFVFGPHDVEAIIDYLKSIQAQ